MSITSRISSMEEHVTNAYNGLQGLGADLTNVDKNIENISMVLDDIYDSMPSVSGEGTSLTLEDTRVGKIKSTLKGNTSQTTYSGKNLIPTSDIISTSGTTSNGITFTRNSDGSITANGTATGAISIYINNDYTELSAGTYTFSDSVASGESGTTFFLYADVRHTDDTGWDTYNFSSANTTTGMTQTIPEAFKFKTRIVIRSGQTLNNVVFKPMMESGSTATSYEPYTGGTASPNPEFPQPVNVVSGDNEINVVGKNILDLTSLLYRTSSTSTSDREANSFTQYGMGNWGNTAFYIKNNKKNTNYTISMKALSSLARRSGVSVYGGADTDVATTYTNIGTQWLDINANTQGSTSYSFNSGDYEYLIIRFWNNGTDTALSSNVALYISDVQLEYGSSFTGHEPYNVTSYPINLGVKNLWNSEDMKSGYLPQSGSYPTTETSYPNSRYIIVPLMKGQSITTYSEVTYNAFRIRYIDKDTNLIVGTVSVGENNGYCNSNATYQSGFANGTITATKDVLLGLWDFDGYMSTSGYYKITYGTKIQTITDNQIELCKIGNYQDYFYKDSGKWYLHKEIGKVVLDGSESGWHTSSLSVEGYKSYYVDSSVRINQDTPGSKCNYFEYKTYNEWQSLLQATFIENTYQAIGIRVVETLAPTLEDFKTWLSTHNTIAYFVLETPTNTEITYQPLIDQLNELELAQSKENQTNISQVNNDLPFIISASALKEWSV